jgi:hypothetical protein
MGEFVTDVDLFNVNPGAKFYGFNNPEFDKNSEEIRLIQQGYEVWVTMPCLTLCHFDTKLNLFFFLAVLVFLSLMEKEIKKCASQLFKNVLALQMSCINLSSFTNFRLPIIMRGSKLITLLATIARSQISPLALNG